MLDNSPRFTMIELGETGSTNAFLRDYRPLHPTDITLVTAEYQSAGRGQGSNHWESAPGQNLLFSLLLHPVSLLATHLFVLSEAMALSIRDALVRVLAASSPTASAPLSALPPVTVKWPNDLYVGDRKIAGILIENELQGAHIHRAIIGCGIDINQRDFEFSHAGGTNHPTPVSLRQLLGRDTERSIVLNDIIDAFTRRYEALRTGEPEARAAIHAGYLDALYRRSGFHTFQELSPPPSGEPSGTSPSPSTPESALPFQAEIADVEPTGHLVLRDTASRLRRYAFKEVRFLPPTIESGQQR